MLDQVRGNSGFNFDVGGRELSSESSGFNGQTPEEKQGMLLELNGDI